MELFPFSFNCGFSSLHFLFHLNIFSKIKRCARRTIENLNREDVVKTFVFSLVFLSGDVIRSMEICCFFFFFFSYRSYKKL